MSCTPHRFGLVLAALAAATLPARADDVAALYQAYWAGIPAAQIRVVLREAGGAYRDEVAIASEGLPRLVTHFRGSAAATGQLAGTQPPMPRSYDATYDLRKRRDRRLAMPFVARGGAVVAERGPGDTSRKPPLTEKFRRNVVDPLSALTAIRQALRRGEARFTVPVYDGARRFDADVQVLPPDRDGLQLRLTLHAIAGFKGESSDDGDPDDAPRPVSLTMSNDGRLVPLRVSVSLYFLPLTVELVKLCAQDADCAW